MITEHILYSAAIAILTGMIFYKYTGRDSSWIIILFSWAPDADGIINIILKIFGIGLELDYIFNVLLHTIAMMVIFGIVAAFLLYLGRIKFIDALFFL